jgi:hypothetical protein
MGEGSVHKILDASWFQKPNSKASFESPSWLPFLSAH